MCKYLDYIYRSASLCYWCYTGNAFSWAGGSSVNNVEVYNTQTDTWSVRKAMPQALGSLTSILYKGKIYVFGGMTTNTHSVA
ncbi:hypothetical protein [Paenibacillus polymyxa]|uniref:hypothetical protein n=1 Tax=Paenibacillus polymyxa TaxID=1406 RepID=UPI0039FBAB9F